MPQALRTHLSRWIYEKRRTTGEGTPAQFLVPRGDANEY